MAAFISIYCTSGDIKTALKRSAATGANVAESNALGTLSMVEQYMTEIEPRKVEDLN